MRTRWLPQTGIDEGVGKPLLFRVAVDSRADLAILLAKLLWLVPPVFVVNVHQAKTQLSRLLARVEAGEEVVIARRGEPVARLVSCRPAGKRRPDVLKGKLAVPDSFFFDPLPEEELKRWEGR